MRVLVVISAFIAAKSEFSATSTGHLLDDRFCMLQADVKIRADTTATAKSRKRRASMVDTIAIPVVMPLPGQARAVNWAGRSLSPKGPPEGAEGVSDLGAVDPGSINRSIVRQEELPLAWAGTHHVPSWQSNAGADFPFPHDFRDPNKAWSGVGRAVFLLVCTLVCAVCCVLVHFWPQVLGFLSWIFPIGTASEEVERSRAAAAAITNACRQVEVVEGPTPDYDADGRVVDWFEKVAAENPDSIAIVSPRTAEAPERALTYRQLKQAVDELAALLTSHGVGRGSIVALVLERSIGQVVSVFAVLKAGAGFLPIGSDLPRERQSFMVEESEAAAVIAYLEDEATKELALSKGAMFVTVPADGSQGQLSIAAPNGVSIKGNTDTKPQPSDTAMLIYTSGTTGTPKGIVYDHRHLSHGVWSFSQQCKMTSSSVGLLKSPYFWAIIEWELFPALTVGGKLVVASADGHKSPEYLTSTVHNEEVSVLMITPTVLDLVMDIVDSSSSDAFSSVRHIVTVGEPLTSALANRVVSSPCRARLHNFYGASESSCTVYTVPREGVNLNHFPTKAPAGLPQPHSKVYVMQLSGVPLKRAPVGEAGEICFGGVLAARYWKQDELTKQKWVETEFGRLYRTGDMGRWRNGVLEVIGRTDRQVKIRGVRVEPEEVEAVLKRFTAGGDGPALREVAVVATKEPAELVAFASARDGASTIVVEDLRKHCKASLAPAYVPKHFVLMGQLPLLPNGKLNITELRELANKHAEEEGEVVIDSMGQMKQLSKSAVLETAIIHRCYAWWMIGVLADHFCRCAMDVDNGAKPKYELYGFCTSLASPSVQPWTELIIRSLGNDQDMFGFIMLGAYQESRPGRDGKTSVNFGWKDLWMFGVYMAVGFPIPQLVKMVFQSSTWPIYWMGDPAPTNIWDYTYMAVNSHVGGHRWYLWMVILARMYMGICEKIGMPGWLQTVLCFVPCFIPVSVAWDACVALPGIDSPWEYIAGWVFSASGGECAVYYQWVQWFTAFYVLSFYAIRPFLKLVTPYLPMHRTLGAVALSLSMLLGLLVAMFDYPSTALEGEDSGLVLSMTELFLTILQPALFVYGIAHVPVNLAWWGNTTLGCYVFHFFFRDQFSVLIMCMADLFAWDITGILLITSLLALFILFTTVMGPISHYILIAPTFVFTPKTTSALQAQLMRLAPLGRTPLGKKDESLKA